MANKMLIDASHPEETRVVVIKGNRIEEFDFESEHKKQLKGNIYLAKVTRVEPSLQAAFVEYGGNRHGFLAFSEIHPDYYQIPVADRQALIEELARAAEDEDEDDHKPAKPQRRPRRSAPAKAAGAGPDDSISEATPTDETSDGDGAGETFDEANAAASDDATAAAPEGRSDEDHESDAFTGLAAGGDDEAGDRSAVSDEDAPAVASSGDDAEASDDGETDEHEASSGPARPRSRGRGRRRGARPETSDDESSDDEADEVDELGAEDAMEEVPVRQRQPRKQYKIQEVIKRRQILLVQVVKEERGNKGAALTTYLSLAGRYSVLMPNTARGGGISRKITNVTDRKRLKEVVRDLDVPRGMGIILRTAGANRTKAEVKRDYEYLMRLWETVRTLTLASSAPALVYEEGSLIKRSIRDLYNKEIDQILVSGDAGYREAKDFMRMLMPSQAKVVQPYREQVPIFARQGIEAQLDRMLQPQVTLKSGGYIIINQTEALVAIDVNSGRSTREHSIEDTAFRTNMEAAEEVARQLRLRDLAGLIVIDFIDMEEKRNNRSVEKKLKDCLKDDRARIQLGRISHFGLMEMSRQRIRASVLESATQVCPVCEGMGFIRSDSSLALHVIRTIEEQLQKHSGHDLIVRVPTATALYVLNEKRGTIDDLERHFGLRIFIQADDGHGHQHLSIEHGEEAVGRPVALAPAQPDSVAAEDVEDEAVDEALAEAAEASESAEVSSDEESEEKSDNGRRRKRRRRRRREPGGLAADGGEAGEADDTDDADGGEDEEEATGTEPDVEAGEAAASNGDDQNGRRRRRRGRRGGRRQREGEASDGGFGETAGDGGDQDGESSGSEDVAAAAPVEGLTATVAHYAESAAEALSDLVAEASPSQQDRDAEARAASEDANEAPAAEMVATSASDVPEPAAQSAAEADADPVAAPEPQEPAAPREPVITSSGSEPADERPKKTGWWSRRGFF
ncbi:Rne/Rng family ribonuclease [Mangrovibrevibacter kandeliae]|uniref:Rne/Rng family ribonuclease n=1 Tax=Mangrovibrevibacter kandeliae TaxID=2968473 RepID=UPI00211918F6|nr:ribonuclease E/G [Aurantimonas sp. CSK15Z-1]MCQ8782532.1 Rne/Rng family ribonuclease [Aurantimonas sp. CSK15Z-1]